MAEKRVVLLDDHHCHLVEADRGVGVVFAVACELLRRQRLSKPAQSVGLEEAVRPDPDRDFDEHQDPVLVHRHEADLADALGSLSGLVDDLVALGIVECLDRAHRFFLHAVHLLLLRLGGPPLWHALRHVSRMRSRWASKVGSKVGLGYRSLPSEVFRVVRARSAWGEEPEKVSRPVGGCRDTPED